MVPYISQLHSFLNTVGTKLNHADQLQIYEAVGYVISSMPTREASQTLRTFSTDVLARIHAIVNKSSVASKDELQSLTREYQISLVSSTIQDSCFKIIWNTLRLCYTW